MYRAIEVVYFEHLISQQSAAHQGICRVGQDNLNCSLAVAQLDIAQEYQLILDGAVGKFEALGSCSSARADPAGMKPSFHRSTQAQTELNGELNWQGQVTIEPGIDDRLYGAPTSTTSDRQLDTGMPIRIEIADYQRLSPGVDRFSADADGMEHPVWILLPGFLHGLHDSLAQEVIAALDIDGYYLAQMGFFEG